MSQILIKASPQARCPCLADPRALSKISVLVQRAVSISEIDTKSVDESEVRLGVGKHNGEDHTRQDD